MRPKRLRIIGWSGRKLRALRHFGAMATSHIHVASNLRTTQEQGYEESNTLQMKEGHSLEHLPKLECNAVAACDNRIQQLLLE